MNKAIMKTVGATTLALLMLGVAAAEPGKWLGPNDVIASKDGTSLFVVCIDAQQILVVDPATAEVVRKIDCPAPPTAAALSNDGATLFVTCRGPIGTVHHVDVATGQVTGSLQVGQGPTAPVVTPDGKLFVCNRFSNSVSVIDIAGKKETARVPTQREPIYSTVTPDGKTVLVSNHLPTDPADSYDVAAVITLINTADNKTSNIRLLNGSSSVREITVSPDGKYAFVVHVLSRYQLPTTQLERGWMNTNAMSIIDLAAGELLNTVLVDEVDLGAANPWGVACTQDGKMICVTHSGTHEISVIDSEALLTKLATYQEKDEAETETYSYVVAPPNDLAFLVDLRKRIRIQGHKGGWLGADPFEASGPRGMAIVGTKAYVAVYFSDKLAVVDLAEDRRKAVSFIALGPAPQMTVERKGELYFHDAWLCFQHWQACSSCHPDARVDGLNWDLLNDGLGNPKNAKSLLLSHKTPPSMISGVRGTAEAAVRSGFRHILFSVQPEEILTSIDAYLKALEPEPSPHLVHGKLSEAAERGEVVFNEVGCADCHPAPLYTDLGMYDVGSRGKFDRRDDFDTPALIECWRTAPYMHDGHYPTLKELFKEGKHGKRGGDIESLTDAQLNDLVEFVLSL
jgi:YVTN family beta-propeller protein